MFRNSLIACLVCCSMIVLGFAAYTAYADEKDDGIMGRYTGKFTEQDWAAKSISIDVVACGNDTFRGVVSVQSDTSAAVKFQIAGQKSGTLELTGTGDLGKSLGGVAQLTATIDQGKLNGKIVQGASSSSFELSRAALVSPTFDAKPPEGAFIVFDGKSLDGWEKYPKTWPLVDNAAMEVNGHSSLITKQEFGDFKMHLEFMTPFMPEETGQGRGNSGVYIFGRYEVQVLDSFGDEPADNLCGGIYKMATPKVCASYPPLTWQTYDITFIAPKFDGAGTKIKDAEISVEHNGVLIHDHVTLNGPTPGGISDRESTKGPLLLQDHGNKVRYRNIWILPLKESK